MKKFLLILAIFTHTVYANDEKIQIVGSSTIYPFTALAVEEYMSAYPNAVAPVVESNGTSAGAKLFCEGVKLNTPSVLNASRKIRPSEVVLCNANGVKDIKEYLLGYDGIAFVDSSRKVVNFSVKDLYKAFAKVVPDASGSWVVNPYKKWSQINPSLPNIPINVYVPASNHGSAEVVHEFILVAGCKSLKGSDEICKKVRLRDDHALTQISADYSVMLQKLRTNKTGYALIGYSFYEQNKSLLNSNMIQGISPSMKSIKDGSYALSRPLFFYVKEAHLDKIKGLKEFIGVYSGKELIGPDGLAKEIGLVPAE